MRSEATETKLASLFDWADVLGRMGLASIFLLSGYGMDCFSSFVFARSCGRYALDQS
jgi:hypothetical protein